MRLIVALPALGLLAACATTHPGWTGSNATPFDTAQRHCTQSTATMADAAIREEAYLSCMAEKGWTPDA